MPQLDFANQLTIAQVVWMALIFGGLYFLLSSWALPQVETVLSDRAHRISADLDSARAAKGEADAAAAEISDSGRRASTEAQAAIAQAVAQAKAEAAEQTQLANEKLDAQLAEAEGRIVAARNAAMGALRQVATETTAVVVDRLTGQPAPAPAVESAVANVMSARA